MAHSRRDDGTVDPMHRGFTLLEVLMVLVILSLVIALGVPRVGSAFDRIATDGAARDLTTAIAVARAAAVLQGTRARLRIGADSLRVDREGALGWEPYARWPGPGAAGVSIEVTNAEIVFGPLGLGWGAANTRVLLRRGSQVETVTTSRLGRVKRG
jgi:prepilin-type N-terminal cleavage/methylation domain-containing protein